MAKPEVKKWWESFRQQLISAGININNPSALCNILVNNKKSFPLDKNGERFNFDEVDKLSEYLDARSKLQNAFHYAFMEVKGDGTYKKDRPKEGETFSWMYENMKSFDDVPESMQEYLFNMAKSNRLIIRADSPERTWKTDPKLIRVKPDGSALITEGLTSMDPEDYTLKLYHDHKYTEYGFTEEEFRQVKGEIMLALGLDNNFSNSTTELICIPI